MSFTPSPNPWKGVPYVGALIDNIQTFLAGLTGGSLGIRKAGTNIGTEPFLDFEAGSGISLAVVDDAANTQVKVTITGTPATGTSLTITQAAHGFAVGNVLYLNSTTYTKAKADALPTAQVVGIVASVIDANNFVLQTAGHVTGLSGLTSGSVYFLSDSTAGALTTTEPTTVGHVSKPLFVADSATTGHFFIVRGIAIATSPSNIGLIVALG
jgi:hypothetical protein